MSILTYIFEEMEFQLEHLEMEFEAETWWSCSTHEGYKTPKFQLQTLSVSAQTGNPFFRILGKKNNNLVPLKKNIANF